MTTAGFPRRTYFQQLSFQRREGGEGGGRREGNRERERPKEKEFAQDELFLHSALFL